MAKGQKYGGREVGTPNKSSARVKHNLITVFEGIGGVEQMKAWAKANETEFYKLWAKLLPANVRHSGQLDHKHTHVQEAVSETTEWIRQVAGRAEDSEAPQPLPH